MMRTKSRLWTVALVAGMVLMPAVLAAAAGVARVHYAPGQVQWEPQVTGYEQMVLTVSTPDGSVVRREFASGETPAFELAKRGGPVDGVYTYELRVAPRIDPAVKKALAEARERGGSAMVQKLRREGKLPAEELVQSGSFAVAEGAVVTPETREKLPPAQQKARGGNLTPLPAADQVIPDDLIVQGSECVGLDCVNNENFGFDTIRMKENNTRIHFDDTSTGVGFPANDWRLIANDSASGGASKFSIEDSTGAKTPFTITAGAATNSIFVDSTGRLGLRTSTPVLDLHINTSNSPAIRLEQNNSGGFTAQTWDIAGNEANFFVRDVTGGSRLPFRIRPGAPTSSIDISADGDVGVGTASPDNKLHILCNAAGAACGKIENSSATGFSGWEFTNAAGTVVANFSHDNTGSSFRLNATNNTPIVILTNSSERCRFPAPGGNFITCTNNASLTAGGIWADASSRELKQDIVDLDATEALETVQKLAPVKYQYKTEPGEQYVGFIAEDVPGLVAMNDHKNLSPMDVVAVLTKVVQEQQKQIDKLSSRLAELEGEKK